MRAPRSAALALALAVQACGGGGGERPGEPVRGVLHLDPRLADGGSPAAALSEALDLRVLIPDAADPASIEPFRVVGGRLGAAPEGARLIAEGDAAPELVLGPLESADVVALELVLAARQPAEAQVAWEGPEGPAAIALPIARPGTHSMRVDLGNDPRWRGSIDELRLAPSAAGGPAVAVLALRIVPSGFEWGSEPLEDELVPGPGGTHGDAGLRRIGFETRRAWPADLGVPLFASVDVVPRGATLAVSLGPGNVPRRRGDRVVATVDARAPGEEWRRVGSARVAPGLLDWLEVECDLAAYGGRPLELRFCAWPEGADPDADEVAERAAAAPREEHLLIGAPLIAGDLVESRRPNVVLVTLDTTRADAVGTALTPFLNRLAQESLRFDDAWASSNSTTPSHATLLSGLHVEEHGAITNRDELPAEVATVAETLRAEGFHTLAAVSVPHVQAGAGFGQGFDAFRLHAPGAEQDGATTLAAALAWIERERERPFFLWVHLFDPHTPYATDPDFVASLVRELDLEVPDAIADPPTMPVYDDPAQMPATAVGWSEGVSSLEHARFLYALGVAYADRLCERLYQGLAEAGALDDTALIVTGDHGEGLGEDGIWFGHHGLSAATLRVPLLVRPPGGAAAQRVSARASGIDVAPTLLALAGVRPPETLEGADLLRLAREPRQRTVWFAFSGLQQVGYHDDREHFVTTLSETLTYGTRLERRGEAVVPVDGPPIPPGTSFLYAPAEDPELAVDLAPERPDDVRRALERLEAWRAERARAQTRRRALTAEEEERLKALGYAGD